VARYIRLRAIPIREIKKKKSNTRDNSEYLKNMIRMNNILISPTIIAVFFLFFQVSKPQTINELNI